MSGGQAGKDRLASDRPQTFGLWARITRSLVYAPLLSLIHILENFRGNFWIDKSAKIRYPVSMQIRNIGILAHVDAGKTTLTEQMLFASGAINRPGRVDDGTAHTDRLAIERRRGISVRAACTAFSWRDARIQLLDTPGRCV